MLTKFISALALGSLLALNVCAADTANLNIPASDISLDGSRLVLQPHDAAADDAFKSSMFLNSILGGRFFNGTALQGYAESPAQRSDDDEDADDDTRPPGGGGYINNGTALHGYSETLP